MSGTNNQGVPGAPMPGQNNPMAQELLDALTGGRTAQDMAGTPGNAGAQQRVNRDPPTPEVGRASLVKMWVARVQADKQHHDPAFKRMASNMRFTHGDQWSQDQDSFTTADKRGRYVANIALRHVQQRTASLYASNPKVVATRRERMLAVIWDGDMATLQAAQQQLANAAQLQQQQAQITGVPVPPAQPGAPPPGVSPNAMAILTDYKNVQGYEKMLKRVCKTLELLWDYNVQEQTYSFKSMMKLTVRRTIVAGVGYVKLGFQRAMQMAPDIEMKIADATQRLANIERLSDDLADGQIQGDSAEAESLRLAIQQLMTEPQIIVREGLIFDYPESRSIIPDKKCKSLRGFLGADWVTEEYMLTPEEIQEVYGVDVGSSYRAYSLDRDNSSTGADAVEAIMSGDTRGGDYGGDDQRRPKGAAVVWETYHRKDGLVYVTCEGYPDFLREPAAPDVYVDGFWPWFPMLLNEGYNDRELFPRSDIDLMRDMQMEVNRSRQALREHRRANRPKTFVAAGVLEDADKDKLATHPANAVIELNGLAPGTKIEDVLQAFKGAPIDPALYDTNQTFEDLLRVLGTDQAGMGQTTDATATEAAAAQSSQHNDLASCLDDQDELLTALATAGGKLLLLNVSAETVQKVVGPGAVWPQLSKEDVIENIYLQVQAGSTGRPNKQQEMMNAQLLFPILQRIPGISPEWMARELIRRMDDRLDLTDAFIAGMPSLDALNRIQGTVATPEPTDPSNPAAAQAGVVAPPGVPAPAPPPGAGPPPGPPGQPPAPGAGPQAGRPMGGVANDPTAQGPQGTQNAPAVNPVNGLLGPRQPPVPGANGMMPGAGGGPKPSTQGP